MLRLYNSLSRKIEDFTPLHPPEVGIYACGPTVYDYAHIGNFRTYTTSDILVRILKHLKFHVNYIMNITDVGHLTGDNLGDADTGEDRMEKSAKKLGKTAWDVAAFYTDAFIRDYELLNLTAPFKFTKATEHIKEQIQLIEQLEKKGFVYKISDGLYFNTSKFSTYGELSNLDEIKEGARVEVNPEKKNPRDFALWKFGKKDEKRHMEWESPWGVGFPGWHIECSAMSMKYLGESLDIHTGGIDLRSTHHPNEIAQAEAATGKPFVKYWVHGAFILVDGKRMSKSLGNNYTVSDIVKNGFDPLALRYLYLQTHYRQEMNFTWEALEAASHALNRLRNHVAELGDVKDTSAESFYIKEFQDALYDDLNTPKALSIVWDLLRGEQDVNIKARAFRKIDEVLGLKLFEQKEIIIPVEVKELMTQRELMRKKGNFEMADEMRKKIRNLGFDVADSKEGPKIKKLS